MINFKDDLDIFQKEYQNLRFQEIFGDFTFHFIDSTSKEIPIIKSKNNEKINITIDIYKNYQIQYFLVCVDSMMIILKNDFNLFKQYFSIFNNENTYIFPDVEEIISEYIKININKINHIDFYDTNKITIKRGPGFNIWSIIKKCMWRHLFLKSYYETFKERIIDENLILNDFFPAHNENQSNIPIINEDEYIVIGRVASTNSSLIKLAYKIEDKKLFVIKYFKNDKLRNREKRNLLNLSFPFLPIFYGIIKDKNGEALAIEYISGQLLSEINFDEDSLIKKSDILIQILLSLKYIHNKGLIYRDLKPDNIKIVNYNNVILFDFDRSITTDETESTIVLSDFSAPEKNYSFKSDVYSFGLMINYLLTRKEIQDNPKFGTMCSKCTNLNPDERPSIDELISQVFDIAYSKDFIQGNFFYINSIYTKTKYFEKTKKYFILAANLGHSVAQNNLGIFYLDGKYVQRDIKRAILYFELSAKQNNLNSIYRLGMIYYERRDIDKAIYYFTQAANQNHSNSLYQLGIIYSDNIYKPVDIMKAINYFRQAANQNDNLAFLKLGQIYYEGKYVDRNIKKAIYFFTKADCYYNQNVLIELGLIYYFGEYFPRDINKAIYYFTKAALQNNSSAQFMLGNIYYKDNDIKRDIKIALSYYTLAANQKNSEALYKLGIIYFKGKYVNQDIKKAIDYLNQAAIQNNRDAQYKLGSIYFEGLYVKYDIDLAIKYFKSVSHLNQYAKNNLGIIYKTGKGVESNLNDSIYYFKEAIKQFGDSVAMFNLAHIYFYEEAGFLDLDEAIKLLVQSSKQYIPYSFDLLCLSVLKKFDSPKKSNLQQFFINIDKESGLSIADRVIERIEVCNFKEENNYLVKFNDLMNINLVYYDNKIDNMTEKKKIEFNDPRPELNLFFYEGLGFDLL